MERRMTAVEWSVGWTQVVSELASERVGDETVSGSVGKHPTGVCPLGDHYYSWVVPTCPQSTPALFQLTPHRQLAGWSITATRG